jgi:PTH1 family peptidyl-tRNA hydrolase
MHLIVGLGNHGVKYEKTRHNFGFLLADKIIQDYNFQSLGEKFQSDCFAGLICTQKTIILKPKTFMNLSGKAVLAAMQFYKIALNNILVLHDDIDFDLGKIKFKIAGGNGGHNGLKSIDEMIGKDYARLRLGVGRPLHKEYDVSDYVLGKFSNEELKLVDEINAKISDKIDLLLEGKSDEFLTNFYL